MRTSPRVTLLGALGAVGLLAAFAPAGVAAQFPAELRGRVLDKASRAPVPGARVEAAGAATLFTTDADGRFVVRGLAAGRWTIDVAAIGYRPERAVVEVEDGHSTAVEIALTPAAVRLSDVQVRADDEATGTATVLDREAIARANARDLGELLAAGAGLTVTRRGGPGAPATLSIRGSTANQVLVLVDGVPLNDPVTGDADLSTVRPDLVERIVVLRGAQAARYGARALAGAVLVETRRPKATDFTLGVGAAAWGERSTHASGGWRGGSKTIVSALLGAGYDRTTGDFTFAVPAVRGGGKASRLNGDSKRLGGLATAAVERGGWSLRGRFEAHELERGMPGSIVQPSRAARQDRTQLGGGVQLKRTGERSEHRLDLGIQRQRSRYTDPSPPLGPAYDDSLSARNISAALTSSARVRGLAVSAGGEFRRLDLRATSLTNGPAAQRFVGIWTQARAGGTIASARWELAATARGDHDDLAKRTYLSPKLGATVSRRRAALHLSWGQAFSPATLADQFFQEGVLARPNPNLSAERVRGELEAGVTVSDLPLPLAAARFDVGLTAFRADIDGMILWFPDHRFIWSPNNYDVQRSGFEITGAARLPNRGIELHGSLSHVAVTYVGPVLHGQVVYRPRLTASASLRAPLASLGFLAQYRHTGRRRTVPASALNTLPAFGVLDLQLSRPVAVGGWTTEITARVENVLDQDAAMLVDYPLPGRSWRLGVQLTRGD
jgi:vitamin B12 transporter